MIMKKTCNGLSGEIAYSYRPFYEIANGELPCTNLFLSFRFAA